MKKTAFALIALIAMLCTKTTNAQTKNITVRTNSKLCSSVSILLYAIDPATCTIVESDWLTYAPGTTTTFGITSPIWPAGAPSATSIVEAVAVQSCRNASTTTPISCTNIGFVRVGNAGNPCGAFSSMLPIDCFEDPGSCGFCRPNSVFNVKYNHVSSTNLEIDIF